MKRQAGQQLNVHRRESVGCAKPRGVGILWATSPSFALPMSSSAAGSARRVCAKRLDTPYDYSCTGRSPLCESRGQNGGFLHVAHSAEFRVDPILA